jgi:hypothetical protein
MTFGQHPIKDPNDIGKINTQQMAQWMSHLFSELTAEIIRTQAVLSNQANTSQRVSTPLGVSNKVWLDASNISTTRLSKKLKRKRIGLYEITKIICSWA